MINDIKTSTRILLPGILLLAICLFSSCSKNEEPEVSQDSITDLTFNITLNNSELLSARSENETWAGPYDSKEATAWENSMTSISVLAYSTSGNYIGRFADMIQVATDTYNAHLVKPDDSYAQGSELENETLRFHVFVNAIPQTPESYATEDDLFNLDSPWINDNKYAMNHIPMWGIKEVKLEWVAIEGTSSRKVANLGTIDLLRSVAKVEITIKSADDDYDYINFITLNGSSAKNFQYVPGYKTDEDTYAVKKVTETKELKTYYSDFKTEVKKDETSLTFYPMASDKKHAIFYIPEQTNLSSDEVTLTLTCGDETFSSSPLKFRTYEDGKATGDPYNILRNHHYKYEVTIRKGLLQITSKKWENSFENNFHF